MSILIDLFEDTAMMPAKPETQRLAARDTINRRLDAARAEIGDALVTMTALRLLDHPEPGLISLEGECASRGYKGCFFATILPGLRGPRVVIYGPNARRVRADLGRQIAAVIAATLPGTS